MADFNKTVDLDKGLNRILDKIDSHAEKLHQRGQEAGEAVGRGFDDGLDYTVEKIKASSIKTDKAFKNLSEKIRKQVQQLSTSVNGKDFKLKIDFSDIDMNSDVIKQKVSKIVKDFSTEGLIEFDAKGSEQQFKNLITLYVKYQEKLNALQGVAPNLTSSKDIELNLRQQLMLALKLKEIYSFLDGPSPIKGYSMEIKKISDQLVTVQKVIKQTQGGDTGASGDYEELAKVLKEIHSSLKIISDTFKNENNSMKAMADSGVTSFTSLSQAIIEVYKNLTQVQSLVDAISQKDFNVTNITQTGGGSSNLQALTQQMAVARDTMEHLRQLYDQAGDTLTLLGQGGQVGLVFEYSKQLQELDLTNINKSIKGANTEMKLASVIAEMQDYIDKLIQINELRNRFNLGEWTDTFVPVQKPVVQPTAQPKSQVTEIPTITQPQNTVATTNTEVQQMTSLKSAVDEVSKAIGRKNAGFIKEKEIVDTSVNAEEAKLRELVDVITNEIGNALDGIKAKFAQSFVVPELDKNNLQASFDEIYNKFVELKDKIGTMKIDVGVNSANITTAIQEAVYAKEIAANYKAVEFEDIFESQFGSGTWQNRFTGEIFDTFDEVDREFDELFKGLFTSKDGWFMGTKEEMLADLLSKQSANDTPEQENWAQVIVEAINTQGGRIVEFIKLLLPKNISSGIDSDTIDEAKLSDAFNVLVQAIANFGNQTGRKPRGFFESIRNNDQDASLIRTPEVDDALRTLGLLSNSGEIKLTIPDTGYRNLGVAIGDKIVASSQDKRNVDNALELKKRLDEAHQLGASVPRILSLIEKSGIPDGWSKTDAIFQLQTRSQGKNIKSQDSVGDFVDADLEQIDRLIHTLETLFKVGLFPDFIGDNVLFDKKAGFSLVDLETSPLMGVETPQDAVNAFLSTAFKKLNIPTDKQQEFTDKVKSRFALPPEQRLVNADTIAAERMVGGQTKVEAKPSEVKLTPTMDEGAVAKVVAENVAKTPATVKVTPVVDSNGTLAKPKDKVDAWVDSYFNLVKHGLKGLDFDQESEAWLKLFDIMPAIGDLEHTGKMTFSSAKAKMDILDGIITPEQLAQQIRDNLPKDVIAKSALNSQQSIADESQSAIDAAKSFVDAANAKKQFVEANKQVAKSAEESAKAVEEEAKAAEQAKQTMTAVADDTVQPSNWDKISQLQKDHNEDPFALSKSRTENVGDKSVRTIVESWGAIKDKDGNLTGEMELNTVKIINDFKKRTDAVTKEKEKIKTAQAYLQKFLTQFNNKTMGKGSLLSGYQDLEILANSSSFKIDDIAKAEQMMSNLDAEYNKVVQSMRKGSSSMNPFVNAINGMDKMEDVLRGISLQFKTLNQQPEWLKNQIIDLYKQLDNVSAESDIYKFAEGFGNLKVSINSVVESIRQQRIEQKLALSDFNALVKATKTRDTNTEKAAKEEDGSAWKTYYLDRAAEQQKIIDTIRIGLTLTEAQEAQLNAMAEKHALILGDITKENNKIEEQKQKYEEIMRLLEKNHADQIEFDNDKSLDTSDRRAYQQILNEERAEIDSLIANTDLNPEQTRSVKQLRGSIEDDRVAKVKKYIDLLKLQQDYEKKAAKEDEGSKLQSFYNEQVAKVKEKIAAIDIQSLENQDEKNKRLALEEAHQRAIAEIQAQREKKQGKEIEKQMLIPQNKKIQERFDAGYLTKDQYTNWEIEFAEYQNYMTGVTKADEKMIQEKKQHLTQLYDALTKMSNASKSFFASGGEILPKEMWFDKNELNDMSGSLQNLYENIVAERFEGMTTAVTRLQPELGKLFFTVDNGNGQLAQYVIHANQATGATKLFENSIKPTLTGLQRLGQTLKRDFTGLLHSLIGGSGIHALVQYMRKGIQAVRELDLAMTELKKVTDETDETYDKFLDTAVKTGARIGRTITDVTSATAEFAKLGYNIEQASSMAESALIYANVGDNVDVETGSQSIISTLKAFGIEADNTMSIVDKFNEVGELIALR